MRAKLAVALAGFGLLLSSAMQTSVASELTNDVHRILYKGLPTSQVITQSAVIEGSCPPAAVQTSTTVLSPYGTVVAGSPMASVIEGTDEMVLREIPAVLAPTNAGVAIITQIPSDVDMRREDLLRRVTDASCAGAINAAEAADLKTALGQVGTAEIAFRADGLLNVAESRRLYRAMDKIGSDLDYYSNPSSTNLLGMKIVPGPWVPTL